MQKKLSSQIRFIGRIVYNLNLKSFRNEHITLSKKSVSLHPKIKTETKTK